MYLGLVATQSHPGGTGFKGMKGSPRAAELLRLGIGEDAASVTVEACDGRGHAETLRLGTVKRDRGPDNLEMLVPWDKHQEQLRRSGAC